MLRHVNACGSQNRGELFRVIKIIFIIFIIFIKELQYYIILHIYTMHVCFFKHDIFAYSIQIRNRLYLANSSSVTELLQIGRSITYNIIKIYRKNMNIIVFYSNKNINTCTYRYIIMYVSILTKSPLYNDMNKGCPCPSRIIYPIVISRYRFLKWYIFVLYIIQTLNNIQISLVCIPS